MASSKEFLTYILDQLSPLNGVTYRAMMGEYILYYQGKIVGGIYDDRLLLKPTESAVRMTPEAVFEAPYDGAREMLSAENADDRDYLCALVEAVAAELPAGGKRRGA